jgi:hypothetical protein
MWRIYTVVNCADTMRDPDEFVYTELGGSATFESAMSFVKKYVEREFRNASYIQTDSFGNIRACEICSWGRTLCADKMKEL